MRIKTEPAVPVSVNENTLHFDAFGDRHLSTAERRAELRRTTRLDVPNPVG